MKFLIGLLLVLFTVIPQSHATLTDVDRAEIRFKNILANDNPGFENGIARWSGTPSLVKVTSGGNLLYGKGSATWDSASAAQTISSASVTVPIGLYGEMCEASILIAVPSGTATHTLQVFNGTDVIASRSVISQVNPARNYLTFPCPTSGTVRLRILSVASNEPLIVLDEAYFGPSTLAGTGQYVGEMGSYAWTPTGSATTNVTYTSKARRNNDYFEATVRLAFAGTSTFTGLTINLPTGLVIDTTKLTGSSQYKTLEGSTAMLQDNGVALLRGYAAYESTTAIRVLGSLVTATNALTQGQDVSGTVPITWNTSDVIEVYFRVPIVGWGTQVSVSPDQQGSSWSGYHDSTCSWTRTNTAYGDPTADSTCTLVERTNRNFGTVTSALSGSDKLPGITFVPKSSGRYFVCATASSYGAAITFDTIGHSLTDGTNVIAQAQRQMPGTGQEIAPMTTCGMVTLSAGVSSTLKIQVKSSGGTITMVSYLTTEWSIYAIDVPVQAILANSVSTTAVNGERIERVRISPTCTSSPCTIASQSGGVASMTRSTTGTYSLNFTAGVFSASPTCTVTPGTGVSTGGGVAAASSATVVAILMADISGTLVDQNMNIICMGPR